MFKDKIIKINSRVHDRIIEFYISAKLYKHRHKYDWSDVYQDIDKAYNDRNFTPSQSTKQEWINKNYSVVRNKRNWMWAYREENGVIYFEDVENYRDLPITLSHFKIQSNTISYHKIKNQPYIKYGIIVVRAKKGNKYIYNIKYKDSIISSDPITIIKDMKRKKPYGKYKLIAYCCINGMMYGLSSDGKLYYSNRSWRDCYEELLTPDICSQLINEHIENLKTDKFCKNMMNRFYNTLRNLIYT